MPIAIEIPTRTTVVAGSTPSADRVTTDAVTLAVAKIASRKETQDAPTQKRAADALEGLPPRQRGGCQYASRVVDKVVHDFSFSNSSKWAHLSSGLITIPSRKR